MSALCQEAEAELEAKLQAERSTVEELRYEWTDATFCSLPHLPILHLVEEEKGGEGPI